MEVSGHLHAPVALPAEVNESIHWTGGWIDLSAGASEYLFPLIRFIAGKKLKAVCGPWFEGCLYLHADDFI
jgi:hypothetical protein